MMFRVAVIQCNDIQGQKGCRKKRPCVLHIDREETNIEKGDKLRRPCHSARNDFKTIDHTVIWVEGGL